MKKHVILIAFSFLLLFCPFTGVFAKDGLPITLVAQENSSGAVSPAKITNSVDGSVIDGKALLSGAIGALIAAIITSLATIYSVKKSCSTSVELLEKDLKARVNEQDRNFKLQLVKIGFEEKKEICLMYLNYLLPKKIFSNNYQMEEIERILIIAQLFVDPDLCRKLQEIKELLEEREDFAYSHSRPGDENRSSECIDKLHEPRFKNKYKKAYGLLAFHTRSVLNLENLSGTVVDRE